MRGGLCVVILAVALVASASDVSGGTVSAVDATSAITAITTKGTAPSTRILKLRSPRPTANAHFGEDGWLEMSPSRLVVADPHFDGDKGAIHIFDLKTGQLLASIPGDSAGDQFSSGGLLKISNHLFVVSSPQHDGPQPYGEDCGSATVIDSTSLQVERRLWGAEPRTYLGGRRGQTNRLPLIYADSRNETYQLFVLSPDALSGRGRLDLFESSPSPENRRASHDNSSGRLILEGEPGDALGSGGLQKLTQSPTLIIKSPEAIALNSRTKTLSAGMGKLIFIHTESHAVMTVYPWSRKRQNGDTQYLETLPPDANLGAHPLIESTADRIITLVGSSQETAHILEIQWKMRNRRFFSTRNAFREGHLLTSVRNLPLERAPADSPIRAMSVGDRSVGGWSALAAHDIVISLPHLTNSLKAKDAGEMIFIDRLALRKISGTTGYFEGDLYAEKMMPTQNGNLIAFASSFDAVNAQDPSRRISDVGLVRIIEGKTRRSLKDLWGKNAHDRAGYFGGLEVSNERFVIDGGKDRVVVISSASGQSLFELPISAQVDVRARSGPFASPRPQRLAVMSARGSLRMSKGNLYWIDLSTGRMLTTINPGMEAFGRGGLEALSTGSLLVFNPEDSSPGALHSGSLWIVAFGL